MTPQKHQKSRMYENARAFLARYLPQAVKWRIKAALKLLAPTTNKTVKRTNSKARPAPQQDAYEMLLTARPRREAQLKTAYENSPPADQPDDFALYRIIGNDLVPRHKSGQSRENVQFILDHEAEFEDCTKYWIVNRIVDPAEENAIIKLLTEHQQQFLHLPFEISEYRKIGWDFDAYPEAGFLAGKTFQNIDSVDRARAIGAAYRLKNNYVMHNNGARNAALEDGKSKAKWVLPWDGNCFLTPDAWAKTRQTVVAQAHLKHFVVPMERITDNHLLLNEEFSPHPVEEPQMIFRSDSVERFNEHFPYGRRPKVELFWRLGIPGPWDRWHDLHWDQPRRASSPDARQVGVAGWVARLNSGAADLEQKDMASFLNRGVLRQQAIIATLNHVDGKILAASAAQGKRAFYDEQSLEKMRDAMLDRSDDFWADLGTQIVTDAEFALSEKVHTVMDKTTLPPSADMHDYWHPAPYWWPNPKTKDGMPYIRKDGQRVPGTIMYSPQSSEYDRTSVQKMFDGVTSTILAWRLTQDQKFAQHAAKQVRAWFLDPETRMNPHLRFAQVRMGHNGQEGTGTGIIEFKDLYYFLDAVQILEQSDAFAKDEADQLDDWLGEYLLWLETSPQGLKECAAKNNHGTYYDLQTASIAAKLGNREKLVEILLRAMTRLNQQIDTDGRQTDEMTRSLTQHYTVFNLQGWFNICKLAQVHGFCDFDWNQRPYAHLRDALNWIAEKDMQNWPFDQIEPFDVNRVSALIRDARKLNIAVRKTYGTRNDNMPELSASTRFSPHDGIRPYFWLS